jgi:hypothetical protein
MKQFQKYGVAAAVASVATGVVATEVSKKEAGDLAIVPYYTVLDGKNTGIHIINTSDNTQVVKVRLRRGADSADALDFNLIMSPYDEWTGNLGPNPDGDGVRITTNDTTCTAPKFDDDGKTATMPGAFAKGAEEGYMEIIGMGQPVNVLDMPPPARWPYGRDAWNEYNSLSVYAEHDEGVPVDCDTVRQHFYRIYSGTSVGNQHVRGVHYSNLTSSALCTANAARTGGACDNASVRELLSGDDENYSTATSEAILSWYNLVSYTDSEDAFKVSWMITDSDGGLEIGDNAVMIAGHSDAGEAMMTNQVPLSFGADGKLRYDPLNFELPNLAYGAWDRGDYVTGSKASIEPNYYTMDAAGNGVGTKDNTHFDDLRAALDAEAVVNDWAAFNTDTGSVATDWVVTLPGQYVMNSNVCALYSEYSQAATACAIASTASPSLVAAGLASVPLDASGNQYFGIDPRVLSADELPLYLADNTLSDPIGGDTALLLWDREEDYLGTEIDEEDDELGFSPGGTSGDPTDPIGLDREVNVIRFNDGDVLGTAAEQDDLLGLGITVTVPGTADRGWGMLNINTSGNYYQGYKHLIWSPGQPATGNIIQPNDASEGIVDGWGALLEPVENYDHTAVVGFAAWERSFADQAGNYGRAVEHSTISSAAPRNPVQVTQR